MAETLNHEYTYISDVPSRQSPPVGYVNTGMDQAVTPPGGHVNRGAGETVARRPEGHQYENLDGNYPRMYSTPIQETSTDQ